MTRDISTYLRQIDSVRHEAIVLGNRMLVATTDEQRRHCEIHLADLGVRVRLMCDQLNIPTSDGERLDRLVAKVMKAIAPNSVQCIRSVQGDEREA